MGKPKRNVIAASQEGDTPPEALTLTQTIARFIKAEGNSVYTCSLPNDTTVLVELPARFRNSIWMRRGGFVLIDTEGASARQNKLAGEILCVIHNENEWRKLPYWPKEFPKKSLHVVDSDDEESTIGRMPPSDSEEDEEQVVPSKKLA